jgi:predicted aspartyl protease
MGIVHVEAVVTGSTGLQETLRFLVDSGATYSLIPRPTWKRLGLEAKRRLEFTLADGTVVKRDVGECHFALGKVDGHSPVILGEKGDKAVLGSVTLEVLGLVLNPFDRTLRPMKMMLA